MSKHGYRLGPFVSLGVLLALTGCSDTPRAPALRDTPVYQSSREGFRFLVPDGWTQTANTELPKGKLEGQIFLVSYRMSTPEQGAMLLVACMDEGYTSDLETHHSEASYGVEKWNLAEPTTTIDVNGTPAQRIIYEATMSNRPMTKEVICFTQQGRVYSFVGMYFSTDEKAAQQIQRAVESIVWL